MKIINLRKIQKKNVCRFPWKHGDFVGFLREEFIDGVSQAVSSLPYEKVVNKAGQNKIYNMRVCRVDSNLDMIERGSLLAQLFSELYSNEYRELMAQVHKVDLRDVSIEINCWRYDIGDMLSSHTDKESKVMTHVIYMKPVNDLVKGGQLILSSSERGRRDKVIDPMGGRSVTIVRSSSSWHSVEPIEEGGCRYSIQVIFNK